MWNYLVEPSKANCFILEASNSALLIDVRLKEPSKGSWKYTSILAWKGEVVLASGHVRLKIWSKFKPQYLRNKSTLQNSEKDTLLTDYLT